MQISPDVDHAAGIKEGLEASRAFPTRITWIRATTINLSVEDSIEVTHEDGGDRGIDVAREAAKKLATLRVAVGSVKTANTKKLVADRKFALNQTAIIVGPRIDKGQQRTVQNNTTAGMDRARRNARRKQIFL